MTVPAKATALVLAAALSVLGCHQAAFIAASNQSGSDLLLRYREGAEVKVFMLPSGTNGNAFSRSGGAMGELEALTTRCEVVGPSLEVSEFGGTVLIVDAAGTPSMVERAVVEFSDWQGLDEVFDQCN